MARQSTSFDTSDELFIQPCNNGIKLIKSLNTRNDPHSYNENPNSSISSLFKLPINFFFVNTESVALKVNETTMKVCGIQSSKDCIGKTMRSVATKAAADLCLNHDRNVIKMNKLIISEIPLLLLDETSHQIISFKFPWYNDDNKVMGVFGCSFKIDGPSALPLSEALTLIMKTGIFSLQSHHTLSSLMPGTTIGDVYLSKRESECLRYLVRGKSIKGIANALGLSARTVENYINRIKFKLGVSYKSDLIEKTIDTFL